MPTTLRHNRSPVNVAQGLAIVLITLLHAVASAQSVTWNWARTLDGGNYELVRDIAVQDGTGDILVAGTYQANIAGIAPYNLPASNGGTEDAFVAKFDAAGNLLWSRGFGSNQDDGAQGVAISATGQVVVTGLYDGSIPALGLTNAGASDAFIVSYDASGTHLWSKSVRSPQNEEGTAVVITGSSIIAYGSFTAHGSLTGLASFTGLTNGRQYAYLSAYDLSGNSLWSLAGMSSADVLSERIATDGTNVYVVGSTNGSSMAWRNSASTTLTSTSVSNDDALFCSAVTIAGSPVWMRMVNNPGSDNVACNGVAVSCGAVYITGYTHNNSTFPGGSPINVSGVHDYLFLAALNPATGTANWVRTASSSTNHGAQAIDLTVGQNGQIYMAGLMEGTVTTDAGQIITGDTDPDLFVARFERNGTPAWWDREVSTQSEIAHAIARASGGDLILGGRYVGGLTLGSNSYPGANGNNLFISSFNDPIWADDPNNPARFVQPGPYCSSSLPANLNSLLSGNARGLVSSLNVLSPMAALNAADGTGANFNTVSGQVILDLGDTLYTGENVFITWRSTGGTSRMWVSTSLDGSTWGPTRSYLNSSTTYSSSQHVMGARARFIRIQRDASAVNSAFFLDGLSFFTSTVAGGTWSGGAHVTAGGTFNVAIAGTYPVTYTVVQGACIFSHTRNVVVAIPAVGGTISGGGTFCPGASGTLTLSGHTGAVLRWEQSTDGIDWTIIANTTATQNWSGFIGDRYFRAVIDVPVCGTTNSTTATVSVGDGTPPVITCPSNISVNADPGSCGAVVSYSTPVGTDNCSGATTSRIAGLASGATFPVGTTTVTYRVTDAAALTATCSFTVTVADAQAPTITCPADINVIGDPATCSAVVSYTTPMGNDNCTGASTVLTSGLASDSSFPVGTTTVTHQVTDAAGLTASCSFTVTVSLANPINTTNASACDSYTWAVNGQTYSSSGTYSEVVGCVTEELILIITPSSTNSTNASACDSYTWSVNGSTYSTSGFYSTVVGCVTEELDLTITATPSASISYAGSPYCTSGSSASVTLTGTTGGTFSSTPGLVINGSTGAVNLGASTPGTYTVTYAIAAAGGCAAFSTTASITVTTAPSASISYTGSPYCTSGSTASVILSGTTGGTFSSAAGLSINGSTGDVNLGESTPDTYTVTYAIAAAGGCAAFSTTASITVTPSSTNTTNASACDSYTWSVNGQTYSSSGTYSEVVGCVTE